METLMCHTATSGRKKAWIAGALLFAAIPVAAQLPAGPNWRRVGSFTMDLALASPATGPVNRVWFAPDGSRLYALSAAGRIFESDDLETWKPSVNPSIPPPDASSSPFRPPVAGARLFTHPQNSGMVFALSAHLYRSGDSGASWTNLTALGDASVIGLGQHDVAVSPRDPDLVIVANDAGVCRSPAAGLSRTALNQPLPHPPLPIIPP